MEYSVIYVIAGSYGEAIKIGRSVVEAHLAACVNILGPVTSIYWWQNMVQEEYEVAMLLKTCTSLAEQVISKICIEHSYKCPCVIVMPVTTGYLKFLEWIKTETSSQLCC